MESFGFLGIVICLMYIGCVLDNIRIELIKLNKKEGERKHD